MALLTPYVINGAKHPARLFRRQLQLASSGAAGVGRPDDFKVLPLNVPGAGVRVSAGGALIPSRDAGASRETYGVENDAEITFLGEDGEGIPGTGSSGGRRDMVIVEVMDPEMSAVTYPVPADPDFGAYSRIRVVPGVPSDATRVEDVPALANVTAYGLAIIDWPASTGTITEAMIEDIRELAEARSMRRLLPVRINAEGTEELSYSGEGGEFWPNVGGVQFIDIPEWATHMNVVCSWTQVLIPAGANPYGDLSLRFGPWEGERHKYSTRWVGFDALAGDNNQRTSFTLGDNRSVPVDVRGTRQPFVLIGKNSSAAPAGERVLLDTGSAVYMDIEFREQVD